MPFFLSQRDTKIVEFMDDPYCDHEALFNTYRQFGTINSMISGWKRIFEAKLKPLFSDHSRQYSLLDIGFGGGDIPLKIAKWAAANNISLQITAIETDQRAVAFVNTLQIPPNVHFKYSSSSSLVSKGRQFDAVISNHLLHHLNNLDEIMREAQKLSKKIVLFNDIERSDMGYFLFKLLSRPVFRSSFITHDGLTSIKRSFTKAELQTNVPNEWSVERLFPYRLLLSYRHGI